MNMQNVDLDRPVRFGSTQLFILIGLGLVSTATALAGSTGGGMPWEGPLDQLLNSLTGPVARVIGAVGIIALGVGIAFSEGGSMMRKALWVVLGLTIAFNALSWGLSFLGYAGGLLVCRTFCRAPTHGYVGAPASTPFSTHLPDYGNKHATSDLFRPVEPRHSHLPFVRILLTSSTSDQTARCPRALSATASSRWHSTRAGHSHVCR